MAEAALSYSSTQEFDSSHVAQAVAAAGRGLAVVSVLESTGPGWDYYLDRLVAAQNGGD